VCSCKHVYSVHYPKNSNDLRKKFHFGKNLPLLLWKFWFWYLKVRLELQFCCSR
jgi:hypothetical protein